MLAQTALSSSKRLEAALSYTKLAIVGGLAILFLVRTFQTKALQLSSIPASDVLAKGESLFEAGCRCNITEAIPLSAFVSFNDTLAEAYCNDGPLFDKINVKVNGKHYARLATIPCVTAEYQQWFDITHNVTLPTTNLEPFAQVKNGLVRGVLRTAFQPWNQATDTLLIVQERERLLVEGGALSPAAYNLSLATEITQRSWDGWTNDPETIFGIVDVIVSVMVVDNDKYLAACRPIGCTELRPRDDVDSWLNPLALSLATPMAAYTFLGSVVMAIMLAHRTWRRRDINKQLVAGTPLSEADQEWTNVDRPLLLASVAEWRLGQISQFGGATPLTAEALAAIESRIGQENAKRSVTAMSGLGGTSSNHLATSPQHGIRVMSSPRNGARVASSNIGLADVRIVSDGSRVRIPLSAVTAAGTAVPGSVQMTVRPAGERKVHGTAE